MADDDERAPSREVREARVDVGQALRDAARRWAETRPKIGVLFSGGLDSSLTALLLSPHAAVSLWTLGLPNSKDLPDARSGAVALGLPLHEILFSAPDVREVLALPRAGWADPREPGRSVRLSLFLALRGCGETNLSLGQGADELFYGYARYARLDGPAAIAAASSDYLRLIDEDWPWTAGIAVSLGKEVGSIFLDPEVARRARRLPPPATMLGEPPKAHLRAIARSLGLAPQLAERPKRALQYGTGIERLVRREATSHRREPRGREPRSG
ncbi:MAG TPA: asparagine synthase-related protein [Thermoplasmata archaeon]